MPGEWLTTQEAASILSTNAGRTIITAYVRELAKTGKIRTQVIDQRTKLYLRADVEAYVVKQRGDGSVRRSRKKRTVGAEKEQCNEGPDIDASMNQYHQDL